MWFTNLDHKKRHEEFVSVRRYNPTDYPKYENFDAIEVSKTVDIPEDWDGFMGVPDTFLGKYNPAQFEIIGNAGDTGWARSVEVQAMGAETIARLRRQGNRAHVTANMNSLYLDRGGMFRLYGKGKYDPAAMERDVQRLMADDDVTRKGGIYEYLLSGGERESALSIRKFTDSQKRAAYERQGGKCAD